MMDFLKIIFKIMDCLKDQFLNDGFFKDFLKIMDCLKDQFLNDGFIKISF